MRQRRTFSFAHRLSGLRRVLICDIIVFERDFVIHRVSAELSLGLSVGRALWPGVEGYYFVFGLGL